MKRDNEFDAIIRAQARASRERAEAATVFAVGDAGACGCDILKPESYQMEYLDRLYTNDSQSVVSIAGQASGTITFNPTDQYFQPIAVAMVVRDATDPMLGREGRVTAVGVKGCQQLEFNNTAPTAATTQYIPSQLWDPIARDCDACPIRWAPYSSNGNGSQNLVITLFNPHPIGISIQVTMLLWGKGYNCCPPWLANTSTDQHFNRPPPQTPTFMTAPVRVTPGTPAPVWA